jgi:hypothetical protein
VAVGCDDEVDGGGDGVDDGEHADNAGVDVDTDDGLSSLVDLLLQQSPDEVDNSNGKGRC